MKYLNTYKIFESSEGLKDLWMFNINSIIDRLKECFVDIEDMGIKVEVTYEKNDDEILVYIDKIVGTPSGYNEPIKLDSIMDTIKFANSYCNELGLFPEGVNYTYFDPKREETVGTYKPSVGVMISDLTKMNLNYDGKGDRENTIDDLLLVYKFKKNG